METIKLQHICKAFDGKQVLDDVSAELPAGKVSCLMAPSGAGKTTLLRILLGLEVPDSGMITGLAQLKKSAVFQEDRLCSYLSPVANIRLVSPALKRQEVLSALEAVGLRDCADQPCRELSGGMCRRVSLVRALMAEYDILFLDEPFKGLDQNTKNVVMEEVRRRCWNRTVLLVTHDPAEAEALGAEHRITLERPCTS